MKTYLTDIALLEGLAKGHHDAMRQLYSNYHKPLIRWIMSKGGKEQDAEDVFQEAVIVLYDKAQDPAFCLSANIGTYLFAVAKRLWLKQIDSSYQRKHAFILDDDEYHLEGSEDVAADLELFLEKEAHLARLEKTLEALGSPCKELLKAFYFESKSMQTIAELFQYTNASNAKTQKYKCLNRLKKLFHSKGKIK